MGGHTISQLKFQSGYGLDNLWRDLEQRKEKCMKLPTISSLERRHKWINTLGNFYIRNDEVLIWSVNASQEKLNIHREVAVEVYIKHAY